MVRPHAGTWHGGSGSFGPHSLPGAVGRGWPGEPWCPVVRGRRAPFAYLARWGRAIPGHLWTRPEPNLRIVYAPHGGVASATPRRCGPHHIRGRPRCYGRPGHTVASSCWARTPRAPPTTPTPPARRVPPGHRPPPHHPAVVNYASTVTTPSPPSDPDALAGLDGGDGLAGAVTAGRPYSRQMMAVWLMMPPTSETVAAMRRTPATTRAGGRADQISPSSPDPAR